MTTIFTLRILLKILFTWFYDIFSWRTPRRKHFLFFAPEIIYILLGQWLVFSLTNAVISHSPFRLATRKLKKQSRSPPWASHSLSWASWTNFSSIACLFYKMYSFCPHTFGLKYFGGCSIAYFKATLNLLRKTMIFKSANSLMRTTTNSSHVQRKEPSMMSV